MDAGTADRQPWTNNRNAVIAVVAIVALVVIGIVLFLVLNDSSKHKQKIVTTRIGPTTMKAPQLKTFATSLKTPIYWAGPLRGFRYEFTRTTLGFLYVRYLPHGVPNGANGSFLIISTYPFINAYNSLRKFAQNKAKTGPGGSVIYVRPKRTNILMAFPGINYEIEVYDPNPAIALSTAESGNIKPVR